MDDGTERVNYQRSLLQENTDLINSQIDKLEHLRIQTALIIADMDKVIHLRKKIIEEMQLVISGSTGSNQ